jgi:signal peptidase II
VGHALHRLQAARGAGLSGERQPLTDVRVGSATDGRVPVSVATRSFAPALGQWLSLLTVCLACVAADQVTKGIVRLELAYQESIDLAGPFEIHHVRNTGIAFGLFPDAASPVTILTGIAVVWMLAYFARSGARHPILPVALGLLLGGSVSNLADRIRQGYVTDFIDPEYWPAFNLGDVFITVGVITLLMAFLFFDRRGLHRRPKPAP